MQSNWNWLLNAIWFNLIKFNSIWFCWWSDWCWWWCRWGLRCRGSKWPPSNSFKPQPRSWTKSVKHVWTYSGGQVKCKIHTSTELDWKKRTADYFHAHSPQNIFIQGLQSWLLPSWPWLLWALGSLTTGATLLWYFRVLFWYFQSQQLVAW